MDVAVDPDRAEQGRADAEDDPVADDGMTLGGRAVGWAAPGAEGDLGVHRQVIAGPCGLPNHHTGAVVDEPPAPDPGTGMNLDAREQPRHLRHHLRKQRYPPPMQAMRDPVRPHRPYALVEQNLEHSDAGQGGITG
ncbi:hypothetical protein [Micromonospora tulbaghiae]|uniref:hypothetical protein n=1 Tax=Micromonospora tulbaghiae TaxID=479978 RepID=UPI0013C41ABB|nr:hypothetical protein [Micromonospora tulbaghiae]